MPILRQFVDLPEGQIHLRRAGQGPVIVMLHEMPLSSTVFVPLMKELEANFDCIAIDLANYGDSSWSTYALSIEDHAAIVHATLQKLEVTAYTLYGVHGGASVAIELAAKQPDDVTALIFSGLPLFTAEERAKLHQGLQPFVFEQDGSHYQTWWQSFQKKWAPTTPATVIQQAVQDIVKAGPNYELGYRAAFDYDPQPALMQVAQPIFLPVAAQDPLVGKNAQIIALKHNAIEEVFDVPQHVSQLAAQKLSRSIQTFIQTTLITL